MWKYLLLFLPYLSFAHIIEVGKNKPYQSIKMAIAKAKSGDTIFVDGGHYKEGNINLTKSITLLGRNRPVLDGEMKYEILSFRANKIVVKGFKIINSGKDEVRNIGAVRLYDSQFSVIENNIFENNFFGITMQRGYKCLIKNNKITTKRGNRKSEESIGDGIHVWLSNEVWIINNYLEGNKDGIYLEKVKNTYVAGNYSTKNLRYGLHFMFSNDNVYHNNVFSDNNAGVAVMYSMNVGMSKNKFINNWGDGAYGLLLKEISFSKIKDNIFENNTTAIFMDGATKIDLFKNKVKNNGWGVKVNSNCIENRFNQNTFEGNTFDMSTNGSLVLNTFHQNYWDKYQGYDLNKDGIGDIPYHPLSLYAVLAEKYPSVMLLFRSFIVDLMDKTEKIIPSLTPEDFVDQQPLMKPIKS
ncbi:nitrous oxide reductase family maturation protein NosD [Elizabethkingia sp. JS20170427COW]|uniref:nitrous oxide reductase family maturation protein NosD n=1 Tax=Elizabethkingia sp. JS20170427COW TaxID=2583851 RepID=UPI001110AE62|nr:nitrous oxide reductase family maturation protein NosD [Elizabethkingia sp. JS20170427COW]QCX53815.1 nitrous oxide reductase family maturation protein NosD [Elizabethkingia sp. JS20170427COW]